METEIRHVRLGEDERPEHKLLDAGAKFNLAKIVAKFVWPKLENAPPGIASILLALGTTAASVKCQQDAGGPRGRSSAKFIWPKLP